MMTRGARHVFLAWTAASTKGAAASGRGSRLSDWFGISWPPYKGATEISDLETRPRRGIAKLESYRRAPSPRLAGVRKSPCRPGDIAAKYVRSLQACDPPTPPPPSETYRGGVQYQPTTLSPRLPLAYEVRSQAKTKGCRAVAHANPQPTLSPTTLSQLWGSLQLRHQARNTCVCPQFPCDPRHVRLDSIEGAIHFANRSSGGGAVRPQA